MILYKRPQNFDNLHEKYLMRGLTLSFSSTNFHKYFMAKTCLHVLLLNTIESDVAVFD